MEHKFDLYIQKIRNANKLKSGKDAKDAKHALAIQLNEELTAVRAKLASGNS